jgi:ankyrin repeat protein
LDAKVTTVERYIPLHFYIVMGDEPEVLELLLEAGADANAVEPKRSVLRMAVSSGGETSVVLLRAL